MKRYISIFLVAFCCLSCTRVEEPNLCSLFGEVTDKATGEPVKSAGVELLPVGQKSVTGSNGTFEFTDIEEGTYKLYITKTGYKEYTSNDIVLKATRENQSHSIQIEKLPPALTILDDSRTEIDSIDFGEDDGVTMRSFNIFNNGEDKMEWSIAYQCNWIKSLSKVEGELKAGATQSIVITIDRDKLNIGHNSTIAHIVSNNGSKQLTILASCTNVIQTLEATDIGASSAVLNGNLLRTMTPAITEYGFVYGSMGAPALNNGAVKATISGSPKTGPFSTLAANLEKSITYYARAFVTNGYDTIYGGQIHFTTIEGLPKISTSDISERTATSAMCGGTITSDGGYPITARGVCWSSTSAAPTIEDSFTADGTGTGTFISKLSGLTEATAYYVRAYATNKTGTSYGEQKYFTTEMELKTASVTTLAPTNITSSSATLNGCITEEGYPTYTERGFCYNTSGMPTIYDVKVKVPGSGEGAYTATISIDVEDYYVRAYVIQNGVAIYGEQKTFGPELLGPVLFIGDVDNIGFNSATVYATISDAGLPPYSKRGFCYGLYTDPKIETGNCLYMEENANSAEAYHMTLSNLTSNTRYYVRAYVEWLGHRVYSGTRSFETAQEVTVMIQNELLNAQCVVNNSVITWSGMLLGGTYSSISYVSLGFVYDTKSNPTIGNGTTRQVAYNGTETDNGVLGFYANVTGLQNGVIYFVRAYVQMSYGYVYSDEITIQKLPIEPNIQTYAISNLLCNNEGTSSEYWQAQFQGVFYADGTPPAQDWGFVYGTNSNPQVNDGSSIMVSRQQHVAVPNTTYYVFATNVTGLSPNKIYYVRAFARTAAGYTYGGVLSFSTY